MRVIGDTMAGPTISEFSFGYALTEELVTTYKAKGAGAPTFPSLIDEGSLGYDVAIPGIPVFLQFKLADHLQWANAKEWYLFHEPYFRMKFYRRDKSHQHALLVALQASGENVFYASPRFSSPAQLSNAYVNSQVEKRTAFWKPADIGPLPDDQEHYLCYGPDDAFGYFCSEPRQIPVCRLPGFAARARGREGDQSPRSGPTEVHTATGGDDLNGLYDKLVAVRSQQERRWDGGRADVDLLERIAANRPPIVRVRLAARILYDSTPVFL